jgi:hypothetical protein
MNKQVFISLCTFGLITIILFFEGLLGIIFTARELYYILELEKNETIETASITGKTNRTRTPDFTIYFITINDNKTYRFHLLKFAYGKVSIGDKIEVKFNDARTLFLITNFKSAIYAGYIVQIGLFLVCFLLSILFLRGTIDIYKQREVST